MKLKSVGLVAMLALVGAMEANSSTDSTKVTRSKVLEVARTHGMVQRTPLLPLIIRAISSYKTPEKYAPFDTWQCPLANDKKGAYYAQLIMLRADPERNKAIIEAAEAFVRDSQTYHALCARDRLNLVMKPRSGWESTNPQDMMVFATLVYLLGDSAVEMLATIAAELSVMNGATEAELIALAQERFVSAASEYNRVVVERDSAKLHLVLGKTGHGVPVHYQVTNESADVAIDAYGLLLVKNGVEWLGRGYVKGTNYTIETVSQQAVKMANGLVK